MFAFETAETASLRSWNGKRSCHSDVDLLHGLRDLFRLFLGATRDRVNHGAGWRGAPTVEPAGAPHNQQEKVDMAKQPQLTNDSRGTTSNERYIWYMSNDLYFLLALGRCNLVSSWSFAKLASECDVIVLLKALLFSKS